MLHREDINETMKNCCVHSSTSKVYQIYVTTVKPGIKFYQNRETVVSKHLKTKRLSKERSES